MPMSRSRFVRFRLSAIRAAEARAASKEASASPCWRARSTLRRSRPEGILPSFITSTFHAPGREAGDKGFLQEEGDQQRRQGRQYAGGGDEPVIRRPARGEIGDGDRQGLGPEVV